MMYTVHMRFTLRLIAYLILHVPTLFSDHSFPDTKQREKLPVWAAILRIPRRDPITLFRIIYTLKMMVLSTMMDFLRSVYLLYKQESY